MGLRSGCLALAATLLLAASAQAIPITTVGGVDTVIDYTTLANSGQATERQWIADVLNVDPATLVYTQFENSGGEDNAWLQVDQDSSLWAIDFNAFGSSSPSWFLVKLGNATYTHYLYENIEALRYGVIDLDAYSRRRGQVTIELVSHTGATAATSVPEPTSMSLVLLGLAAAGVSYRRRRSA